MVDKKVNIPQTVQQAIRAIQPVQHIARFKVNPDRLDTIRARIDEIKVGGQVLTVEGNQMLNGSIRVPVFMIANFDPLTQILKFGPFRMGITSQSTDVLRKYTDSELMKSTGIMKFTTFDLPVPTLEALIGEPRLPEAQVGLLVASNFGKVMPAAPLCSAFEALLPLYQPDSYSEEPSLPEIQHITLTHQNQRMNVHITIYQPPYLDQDQTFNEVFLEFRLIEDRDEDNMRGWDVLSAGIRGFLEPLLERSDLGCTIHPAGPGGVVGFAARLRAS